MTESKIPGWADYLGEMLLVLGVAQIVIAVIVVTAYFGDLKSCPPALKMWNVFAPSGFLMVVSGLILS